MIPFIQSLKYTLCVCVCVCVRRKLETMKMMITKFKVMITIGGVVGSGEENHRGCTKESPEGIGDVCLTILCYALEIYLKSLS